MQDHELASRYQQGVQSFQHELDLLLRRFNFFLVGTSFVITAFAVLISSNRFYDSGLIPAVTYLVIALGSLLAIISPLSWRLLPSNPPLVTAP